MLLALELIKGDLELPNVGQHVRLLHVRRELGLARQRLQRVADLLERCATGLVLRSETLHCVHDSLALGAQFGSQFDECTLSVPSKVFLLLHEFVLDADEGCANQ